MQVLSSVWRVSESVGIVYRYFCLRSAGIKQQLEFDAAPQAKQISSGLASATGMGRRGEELLRHL